MAVVGMTLIVLYTVVVLLLVVVEVVSSALLEAGTVTVPVFETSVVITVVDGPEPPVWVAVTGQTVVYSSMTSVVTWPILPGQLVTVGAQEVIV